MSSLPPYPEVPRVIDGGKPSRFFLWVGLSIGGLVLAALVGSFFLLQLLATTIVQSASEQATSPYSEFGCFEGCLDEEDALKLIPSPSALALLGDVEPTAESRPGSQTNVVTALEAAEFEFAEGAGAPDACAFVLAEAPVSASTARSAGERAQTLIDLGTYGNGSSRVSQVVRVMSDEFAAYRYAATLRADLIGCPHYTVTRPAFGAWESDLTQVQFTVAHLAVDQVAWHESSAGRTVTVVDTQYGTLVVRSVFSSDGGASISDEQFAAFVLESSRALYALDPIEGITSAPCTGACFTVEDAQGLAPSAAALAGLGTPAALEGYVVSEPRTIGGYADDAHGQYHAGGGDPSGCDFILSNAPVTTTNPDFTTRDDLAVDLGTYGAEARVSQFVQVFESTIWTDRYLTSVVSGTKRCAHVEVELEGMGTYIADLEPVTVPTSDGVTSEGWVETSADTITTVIDLRYANLVTRTVFTQPRSGPGFTQEQIEAFILDTSERMARLG